MEDSANLDSVQPGRFSLVVPKGTNVELGKLPGVGPKTVERLKARDIHDALDLLLFFPRAYRQTHRGLTGPELAQKRAEYAEIRGTIEHVKKAPRHGRAPTEVTVNADGQYFRLFWFNMKQTWFAKQFIVGHGIVAEGKIEWERGHPRMAHPTVKVSKTLGIKPVRSVKIEPIYSQMEDVRGATIRKGIEVAAKNVLPLVRRVLPEDIEREFEFPSVQEALAIIHLLPGVTYDDPQAYLDRVRHARERLVFEEFYTLQVDLAHQYAAGRRRAQAPRLSHKESGRELIRALPFSLTGDQKETSKTLVHELDSQIPMRRLLQGDVGSGKTVLAFCAAAVCAGSQHQSVLMAPTEVLAKQHFEKAKPLFDGLGMTVGYLSGTTSSSDRSQLLADLETGAVDVLVGTHAVFQSDVVYAEGGDRLGLVIVDEQHKFGVEQIEALLQKGRDPHFLAMTATPIPRALAHACFGELDLSIVKEKPPGRKPIRTVLRSVAARPRLYAYVKERVEAGEQAFIVFPLIEASDAVSHRANVLDRAEHLANNDLKGVSVGVLHGRMSPEDKNDVMDRFRAGEIQVLCATTVIEVGVDVPQATLMVIESAEVFGLSQLHQLRGRVGRSDLDSMCVVLASHQASADSLERLRAFESTEDGFRLAEIDLAMRGAGLFLGARQAGRSEFRFGDILKDSHLLEEARDFARRRVLGDVA